VRGKTQVFGRVAVRCTASRAPLLIQTHDYAIQKHDSKPNRDFEAEIVRLSAARCAIEPFRSSFSGGFVYEHVVCLLEIGRAEDAGYM